VNYNLALLVAEEGNLPEAEKLLRTALKADPEMAEAAYNLGILLSSEQPGEAIRYCRRAAKIRPQEPKYAYTLAFFLNREGQVEEAARILEELILAHPSETDGYALLGSIYERQNRVEDARRVYSQALAGGRLNPAERRHFEAKVR
jgi:predicted Zn-dependent protease